MSADGNIPGLTEIDAEIARLTKERERLTGTEERRNRRLRRRQLGARWFETLELSQENLGELRKIAGSEQWLFQENYLEMDGWTCETRDEQKLWKLTAPPQTEH